MDIWQILRRHEGVRYEAYCDACGGTILRHFGHWRCNCLPLAEVKGAMTIGIGHNLSDNPLSDQQAMTLLADDLGTLQAQLYKLPWYNALDTARQWAIVDMAFTMGVAGVQEFGQMIAYIERQQWELAADAIMSSKWASEAPARAAEDAAAIRTGAWSES